MDQEKLIILDRDGVINLESDQYVKSEDEWIPIQSSLKAIAKLNRSGYKVAIATNQSGLSRGYFDTATLAMIHKKMELALAEFGGHIDALEYCPDHPDNAGPNRKPNPGMINNLLSLFRVNPEDVYFVGDSISDIQCALNAGCHPVLVLTGKGEKTNNNNTLPKDTPIFDNLDKFVDSLL